VIASTASGTDQSASTTYDPESQSGHNDEKKQTDDDISALFDSLVVTSIEQATGMNTSRPKQAFEVSHSDKVIYFPSNYKELSSKTYLTTLAYVCANAMGYTIDSKTCKDEYTVRLKIKEDREVFLKILGIPFAKGELPTCPKAKSIAHKALTTFITYRLQGMKESTNLFNTIRSVKLHEYLLGDAWGKTDQGLKRIIDFVIFSIKNVKNIKMENLLTYRKSLEVIKKQHGFVFKAHKSPHFTRAQQGLVDTWLTGQRPIQVLMSLKSSVSNKALVKAIDEAQPVTRKYKLFVKNEREKRAAACLTALSAQEKKRKTRVQATELMSRLENTEQYSVFNPTYLCQLFDVRPYHVRALVQNNEKYEACAQAFTAVGHELQTKGLQKTIADNLVEDCEVFLNKMQAQH
jgi:hypothetical protein